MVQLVIQRSVVDANATEKIIDIATAADVVDESNGTITVRLLSDDNTTATYTISTNTSNQSAEVSVTDDDALPVYSIAPVSVSVVESNPAQFRLTSPTASSSPVTVRINVSQIGNVLSGSAGNTTAVVDANATEKIIDIATEDDVVDESNGTITVTLLADENTTATYTISTDTNNQSAEVEVTDDDEDLPVVNLSTSRLTKIEGQIVVINVTLDRVAPADGLSVSYTIEESGQFVDSYTAGINEFFIPAGETSRELKIQTDIDNNKEPNGSITISLNSGNLYVLGTSSAITVNILDTNHTPKVSFSGNPVVAYDNGGGYIEFALNYWPLFTGIKVVNVSISGITETDENRPVPNTVTVDRSPSSSQERNPFRSRVILQVPIHEDQINERTGQITATITAPSNPGEYEIGRYNSQTVKISRFDSPPSTPLPVISVSPISDQIHGDDDYIFKISASHASKKRLTIYSYYNIVNSGKINVSGDNLLYLPAGETEIEYRVSSQQGGFNPVSNNFIDGYALLYLRGNSGYIVAQSPHNYAEIELRRYNEPTGISIVKYLDAVESNSTEYARFQITASTIIQTDRIINVDVREGDSNFLLLAGVTKVVLPAGKSKVFLEVPLEKDFVDEPHGVITATILPGTGYTVAKTHNSASVNVFDGDGTPIVYLNSATDLSNNDWVEGSTAYINIMTTERFVDGTRVNFRVSDGGDNLYNGAEYRTVIKDGWFNEFTLKVDTNDDSISEENGIITIEVLPGDGYEVSSTHGVASYTVYDDDLVNKISIQALDTTITEGQNAWFRLTSSTIKKNSYYISFNYDDGDGDFIGRLPVDNTRGVNFRQDGTSKGSVYMSKFDKSKLIGIPTLDDEIYESDGQVTISLIGNSDHDQWSYYTLSSDESKNSATVTVLDNDQIDVDPNLEEITPILSISPVNATVVESNPAQFRLSASSPSFSPITVKLNLLESGNVLNSASGDMITTIPAFASEHIVNIATEADLVDEIDGVITVTLLADDNSTATYTINSDITRQSAEVTVTDDDESPIYSIAPIAVSVIESNPAQFRLTSPTASTSQVTVRINIAQTGNVLAGSAGDTTTTVPALATEKIIDIATEDDDDNEPDGVITLALLVDDNATATYTIATDSRNQSAEVTVYNDDIPQGPPVVNLSTLIPNIVEGQVAKVNFNINQVAPVNGLHVNFSITESDNYLENSILGTNSIVIPAGEISKELRLRIANDYFNEPDGEFTISLIRNSAYILGTKHSVTVSIRDDKIVPKINIIDARAVYDNGVATAEFYLQISRDFAGTKNINVSFSGAVAGGEISMVYELDGNIETTELLSRNEWAVLKVPINQNLITRQTSGITATILAPSVANDYKLGHRRSWYLDVFDFDFSDLSTLPVISVSSISRQINGVEKNYFKISASRPSARRIKIYAMAHFEEVELRPNSYRRIRNPNYRDHYEINLPAGVTDYEYPTDQISFNYSLQDSDVVKYEFGIMNGKDYIVAPNPRNYAKIEVRNNNIPNGISIKGQKFVHEKWAVAKFRIISSTAFQSDRTINVDIRGENDNFLLLAGPSQIVLPAGELQALLLVPIEVDELDEPDSTISTTILPGADYKVATTQSVAVVKVFDDDGLPVISVSPKLNEDTLVASRYMEAYRWVEGTGMNVSINSSKKVIGEITVNLRVSDGGGNLYDGPAFRFVEFRRHRSIWSNLYVETHSDEISEDDGTIFVEVLPGAGYEVSPTNSTATYTVFDDDESNEISIHALDTTITEGQYAQFEIEIPVLQSHPYHVGFRFDEGTSDFIGGETDVYADYRYQNFHRYEDSTGLVPITFGAKTEIIRIPTVDDDIQELDGRITVTLLSGTPHDIYGQLYTVPSDLSKYTASITVLDNDQPIPAVSLSSATNSMVEGTTATFTFTSTNVANANGLVVNYEKSQSGNFFATNFAGSDTAKIMNGDNSQSISFITHDDDVEEPDGSFTISIINSTNYTLGSTSSITVNVADNDNPPVISISDAIAVAEGTDTNAVFNIAASNPASEARTINVAVSGATGFIPEDQIPTTVVLESNSTVATLNIPIEDDEIDEPDGQINVEISSPTNVNDYLVGEMRAGQVSVTDNDLPATTLPELSVSTISNYVFGTDGYFYRIEASHASENDISMNIHIDIVPFSFHNSYHNYTFQYILAAGTTVYDFTIDSDIPQNIFRNSLADGHTELTIESGEGYRVAPSPNNKARINVRRYNEPLGISIVAGSPTTETNIYKADFQVTASSATQSNRIINVNVSDGDSDFLRNEGLKTVTLLAGKTTAILEVDLVDDEIDEPDGYITATILPGEGYTVATTFNSARLRVNDNDGSPVVYLYPYTTPNSDWVEGQDKSILIKSSSAIPEGSFVKLRISDGGDNLYTGDEVVSLSSSNGRNFQYFVVTQHDAIVEDDGAINVEVIPSSDYEIASDFGSATFTVFDDDGRSNEISIEALESTITEGQFAQFRLTPSTHRQGNYHVYFSFSQEGSDFIGEIYETDGSNDYHVDFDQDENTGSVNFPSNKII